MKDLPPMGPGMGGPMVGVPTLTCWISGCSRVTRREIGLCDDCIEQLRDETNR